MDETYKQLRLLLKKTGQSQRADQIKKSQLDELEGEKIRQLKGHQESLKGTYDNRFPHRPEFFEKRAEDEEKAAMEIAKRKRKIREEE